MLIWIHGSKGMLGKELTRQCAKQGIPYIATDREECDITKLVELKNLVSVYKPTHIVNCAAYTDVDMAEEEMGEAYAINAEGPLNLSLIATQMHAKLIHISTDYVFNGKSKRTYVETDPCDPINMYGQTKWEGEKSVLAHASEACIIRTSWLFGPEGNNFLSSLLRWLQEKEEVKIAADQVNKPTYVTDLAQVILALSDKKGIFHFANGEPISRFELAKDVLLFAKQKGFEVKCRSIHPVSSQVFSSPAKRPPYTALDTTKISQVLGKAPRAWKRVLENFLEEVATVNVNKDLHSRG